MSAAMEELSPSYYGSRLFRLSFADGFSEDSVIAHQSVTLSVDYSAAGDNGVDGLLIMTVSSESPEGSQTRTYRRPPSSIVFTPAEGGVCLVRIGEFAHNKWWGSLKINVKGQLLRRPSPV